MDIAEKSSHECVRIAIGNLKIPGTLFYGEA